MTIKEIKRKYKFYNNKIDRLWSKRQRIEALLYMSLLVEFFTRELIINFEKIVEGAALSCHIGFNPRNIYSRKEIEDQPLGYLINILGTYTKDKALIGELTRFSRMRNKCIHKLFRYEIKDINSQLKNFNLFYYKLVIKLLDLNIKQRELLKKSFAPVCDDCFKKYLSKIVKL